MAPNVIVTVVAEFIVFTKITSYVAAAERDKVETVVLLVPSKQAITPVGRVNLKQAVVLDADEPANKLVKRTSATSQGVSTMVTSLLAHELDAVLVVQVKFYSAFKAATET